MRANIQESGFETLADLTRERPPFAKDVCNQVRKSHGGLPQTKNVPVSVERGMRKLVIYARYSYLVQRDLDCADADGDVNSPTVTGDDVKPFTDGSNKKTWFETIDGYLAAKAGTSGFPLSYIVRGDLEGDYGHNFGQPSFDEELAACGRRGGLYYPQDNKTVWVFLKLKTQGTAAWGKLSRA